MKKKRLIILFSILAIVIITFSCFAYMYLTAAAVRYKFHYYFISDNEDIERLSQLPRQIELGSDPKPGYTIRFLDYSITISGHEDVTLDNNLYNNSVYNVGNDRHIVFKDMNSFKNAFIFNDPTLSSFIEKAAGKKINSEYGFLEASFYCTPEDFSMFDVNKNKGVVILLGSRDCSDNCYQFDNGVVKGFISAFNSAGSLAMFSNCEDPDSLYQLIISGFSLDEIKDILSTIKFDGSNT